MQINEQILNCIDFTKGHGLISVIAQDIHDNEILMIAYMNQESLLRTLELEEAVYWSRSRGCLWHKGETSGNVQKVKEIYLDCDGDALLLKVEQVGNAACHTGKRSCFYRRIRDNVIQDVGVQIFDPKQVYSK
jgi:phosphoribosyl-AMP cyclohydrolase